MVLPSDYILLHFSEQISASMTVLPQHLDLAPVEKNQCKIVVQQQHLQLLPDKCNQDTNQVITFSSSGNSWANVTYNLSHFNNVQCTCLFLSNMMSSLCLVYVNNDISRNNSPYRLPQSSGGVLPLMAYTVYKRVLFCQNSTWKTLRWGLPV